MCHGDIFIEAICLYSVLFEHLRFKIDVRISVVAWGRQYRGVDIEARFRVIYGFEINVSKMNFVSSAKENQHPTRFVFLCVCFKTDWWFERYRCDVEGHKPVVGAKLPTPIRHFFPLRYINAVSVEIQVELEIFPAKRSEMLAESFGLAVCYLCPFCWCRTKSLQLKITGKEEEN